MMSKPISILIVDDNPDDRAQVRRLLLLGSERQLLLSEAETGASAVAACLTDPHGPPGCVILDYNLPDADAPEVLAALRAPSGLMVCPILVLTGKDDFGSRRGHEVLRAGAQDYLNKTWMNAEILARALDIAIERHRLAKEAQEREAALRDSEIRLRLALQASDTGLWTWELLSDVVTWSPECYAIHGMVQGEFALTGTAFFQLVYAEDRRRVEETVRTAMATRAPYECEFRIVRPSGELVWVANRGRATYGADGQPLSILGTLMDITRRKRAEEALRDADRRKDEFLATLAHELRNALAPLPMGLVALSRIATEQDSERIRAMMQRQLGHLIRLVDDLLDVARISSGKVELVRRRIELRHVVESAVEASSPLLDAAQHTLAVRLPEQPLWLDGDLTRLAQVLSNLLNNAAKYTPAGGRVELTAEARAGEVAIVIKDNGYGIPREMLSRVFDLFTQVNQTLSKAQGGLGIGLSLVRGLVGLHGGQVTAASAGPGQGSAFTVRLPLIATPAAELGVAEARAAAPGRRLRVLVIDDNVDAADSIAEVLLMYGHDARAVYNGKDALLTAPLFMPQVVFMDIGLPSMDGYEVARRFRADPRLSGAVLVALTGWGSDEDRELSLAAGFEHHLTKPADPTGVENLLARISLEAMR